MRKLYNLWQADTGWGKYTKKQKLIVVWWCLSFMAMIMSAAAQTFTSFAVAFIVSTVSFTVAGLEVVKNIEIEE